MSNTILPRKTLPAAVSPYFRTGRHRAPVAHGPGRSLLLYGQHAALRVADRVTDLDPRPRIGLLLAAEQLRMMLTAIVMAAAVLLAAAGAR